MTSPYPFFRLPSPGTAKALSGKPNPIVKPQTVGMSKCQALRPYSTPMMASWLTESVPRRDSGDPVQWSQIQRWLRSPAKPTGQALQEAIQQSGNVAGRAYPKPPDLWQSRHQRDILAGADGWTLGAHCLPGDTIVKCIKLKNNSISIQNKTSIG